MSLSDLTSLLPVVVRHPLLLLALIVHLPLLLLAVLVHHPLLITPIVVRPIWLLHSPLSSTQSQSGCLPLLSTNSHCLLLSTTTHSPYNCLPTACSCSLPSSAAVVIVVACHLPWWLLSLSSSLLSVVLVGGRLFPSQPGTKQPWDP